MENKTEKELVWEAIKRIEDWTSDLNHHQFVILPEDIWSEYPKEIRLRIRGLLLSGGLIHLVGNSQWAFQLTATGMMLKESDLKENGSLKTKKSYTQLWIGMATTLAGAIVGASLSYIQDRAKEQFQLKHPTTTVFRPTIQVLHDTIWITAKKTSPKKN